LLGLVDGSISTLAPLFAAALATGSSWVAFLVGMSAALGAAISMAVSEALSDDGELTGRGGATRRGIVTGIGTLIGASFHTLPFLIPRFHVAFILAVAVVIVELLVIGWVRWRYFPGTSVKSSLAQVTIAGAVVFAVGLLLGGSGGI
jgi:VIT1/CCC1 family predicted Fe2+/Mn2+ transporter